MLFTNPAGAPLNFSRLEYYEELDVFVIDTYYGRDLYYEFIRADTIIVYLKGKTIDTANIVFNTKDRTCCDNYLQARLENFYNLDSYYDSTLTLGRVLIIP